jgi:hypothetical protein
MKAPPAKYLPLTSLTEERQRPIRRPPSDTAVQVMAGLLQEEGLAEPLIGYRAGSHVKIVDGRLRLRALQALAESGAFLLPDGTDASRIPVHVLDPEGAFRSAVRANARIRPFSATERVRMAQVLGAENFYKQFVETAGAGRPPGVTRAIANLFERTTEGARLIRRTAENLPPTAVCELMNTAHDRDSSLKRIASAVGDGADVDTAIETETQGATTHGRGRNDNWMGAIDPATAAAQVPLDDVDDVRRFGVTLRERLPVSERNRLERALQGRERPGEPRSGALVSPDEVRRVQRRIRHALQDPNLNLTHGAIADLAHCGEASISEIVNLTGRKRRDLIDDVDAALDKLGRPHDPPDADA